MLQAKHVSWAFCGLLISASVAGVGYAQEGRGRGGPGGQAQTRTRFELATLPEVQAELKLNDEQKKLATDQLAKQREKRASWSTAGGGGGGGGAMAAELAKLNTELNAMFVGKLDDAQKTRMTGLIAQVNGPAALLDTEIAKSLELSEEQISKLKTANEANRAARREAMQGLQDKTPEQRQEITAKLAASEAKSLLGLLSEPQTKKLETLKGAALTMDQTPLRPAGRGNRNQ